MFSSRGLFLQVPCPTGSSSLLPNCIFQHTKDGSGAVGKPTAPQLPAEDMSVDTSLEDYDYDKKRKRRKIYSDQHFFFQAEDGIRDLTVTGVQTCALPI